MFPGFLSYAILPAASFLCGSLPSAFLVVRIFYGKNIYTLGSGNGGATNVYRNFGKLPGGAVLLLDFAKGFLPVLAALHWKEPLLLILFMICFLVLGHSFPPWTRLKGGKGVAVTAGGISALIPGAVPFCLAAFLLAVLISGYVSVGSLLAGMTLPLYYLVAHLINPREDFLLTEGFLCLLFFLILFFHRSNIRRIIRGEEKTWKKVKPDKAASSPGDGD